MSTRNGMCVEDLRSILIVRRTLVCGLSWVSSCSRSGPCGRKGKPRGYKIGPVQIAVYLSPGFCGQDRGEYLFADLRQSLTIAATWISLDTSKVAHSSQAGSPTLLRVRTSRGGVHFEKSANSWPAIFAEKGTALPGASGAGGFAQLTRPRPPTSITGNASRRAADT